MKKIKLLLIPLVLSGCTGLSQTDINKIVGDIKSSVSAKPSAQSSVNPSVSVAPSVKPTVEPSKDGNASTQQTGNPVQGSPEPTPTPINIGSSSSTIIAIPTPCPSYVHTPTKYTAPDSFNFNPVITEGIRFSLMTVIFWDDAKVRYDRVKKQFYSLNCGVDVSKFNDLLKDYEKVEAPPRDEKDKELFKLWIDSSSFYDELKTEEELEERERKVEEIINADAPNSRSIYSFIFSKVNVKEMIGKMRALPYVRSVKDGGEGVGTAN